MEGVVKKLYCVRMVNWKDNNKLQSTKILENSLRRGRGTAKWSKIQLSGQKLQVN